MKVILAMLLATFFVRFDCKAAIEQNTDTLEMQAILLVHADITNFALSDDCNSLDNILQNYDIESLKVKGVVDCLIFKIVPVSSVCKCELIIAYNYNDKEYYRLSGFRTNDFSDFYNLVLLSGNVPDLKPASAKKMLNYVLDNVVIEGYDLHIAYHTYYGEFKNSMYDTTSCYRKSTIRAY